MEKERQSQYRNQPNVSGIAHLPNQVQYPLLIHANSTQQTGTSWYITMFNGHNWAMLHLQQHQVISWHCGIEGARPMTVDKKPYVYQIPLGLLFIKQPMGKGHLWRTSWLFLGEQKSKPQTTRTRLLKGPNALGLNLNSIFVASEIRVIEYEHHGHMMVIWMRGY